MNELAEKLGELAVNAVIGAIRAGKSRQEAREAAAEAIRREDVVSDELWGKFERYVDETKDFERNGAG
jgi:hypothetical protein